MDKYKQAVTATVDAEFDHLWKLASYIHANPEIAFEEKKAASALSSYLHEAGFIVETGIAGLETAFKAVFKKETAPESLCWLNMTRYRDWGMPADII